MFSVGWKSAERLEKSPCGLFKLGALRTPIDRAKRTTYGNTYLSLAHSRLRVAAKMGKTFHHIPKGTAEVFETLSNTVHGQNLECFRQEKSVFGRFSFLFDSETSVSFLACLTAVFATLCGVRRVLIRQACQTRHCKLWRLGRRQSASHWIDWFFVVTWSVTFQISVNSFSECLSRSFVQRKVRLEFTEIN